MNPRTSVWLSVVTLTLCAAAVLAAGPNADGIPACPADPQLTVAEEQDMVYMREEEKLARDVYLTLETLWPVQAFSHIATAEQNHMNAVLRLLDCYGVADPVVDDTVGVFADPVLAQLYVELTTAGALSELDALMAGALIEETDIADLQIAIAQTDQPMIIGVYENLLAGSKNHLRAFDKLIVQAGEIYLPQVLTQEEYDAIVADPPAQGGYHHQYKPGNMNKPGDMNQPRDRVQTQQRSRAEGATTPTPNGDGSGDRLQTRARDGSCS